MEKWISDHGLFKRNERDVIKNSFRFHFVGFRSRMDRSGARTVSPESPSSELRVFCADSDTLNGSGRELFVLSGAFIRAGVPSGPSGSETLHYSCCPPGCCGRDVKLPAASPSRPSVAERKVTRHLSLGLLSIGRFESVLYEVKRVELEEKSRRKKL